MPEVAAPRLGAILAEGPATADLLKVLSAAGLGQMGQPGQDKLAVAARGGSLIAIDALSAIGAPDLKALETIFQNAPPIRRITLVRETVVPMGDVTIPLLLDLLSGQPSDAQVDEAIIVALGKIGTRPIVVIPKLLKIAKDAQAALVVRGAAVDALGAYGPAAGETIPDLQALLQTTEADLRARAAGALGKIGPGRPEIVASLLMMLTECDHTASHASQALGEMGLVAQEAAPALVAALRCHDPEVQAAATKALGWVAPISSTVVDVLVGQLASPDAIVSRSAITALVHIGPGAVSVLVTTLTTAKTAMTRQMAADALAGIGVAAAPALIQLLEREDVTSQTHAFASSILVTIGVPALPFLIQGLRQGEVPARQRILETLYGVGPHAFAGFQWALQDPDLAVDWMKLNTIYYTYTVQLNDSETVVLRGFPVPEALPFLIASLRPVTAAIELRREAARALAFVGPDAAAAVPMLALALADSDTALQCEAALALLLIGSGADAAAPALSAALANTRGDAMCTVDRAVGENDVDVVMMLRWRKPAGYQLLRAELLRNNNRIPHQHILINVLAGLGPKAEVAVPDLVNSLRTPALRRPAAEALAKIGNAAHPALLALIRTLSQELSAPGLAEALVGMNDDLLRSAVYPLLQSTAALAPATIEAMAALAQDDGVDQLIRGMLASALAAHSHPVSGSWKENGLVAPLSRICPSLRVMEKDGSTVELTGFDIYIDSCLYGPSPDAPSWYEIYWWLMSHWG